MYAPLTGNGLGDTAEYNARRMLVLDYNTEFKPQDLYAPAPYRSSNHDPVVVGLRLGVRTLFLPRVVR